MALPFNAEHKLGAEILAFALGKRMPGEVYKMAVGADAESVLKGGGSGNLALMAMALLLAISGHPAAVAFFVVFFQVSREVFMGRELMSRIYGLWHFISVLLVYVYGPPDLKREAKAWLGCFCTILWKTSAEDGRTLFGGMRSAGHKITHDAYEWILAVVSGQDPRRWVKGWRGRWEYKVLERFRPQLVAATEEWRSGKERGLAGFKPMVPVHFYRSTEGVAVWIDRNVNGNTGPWLANKIVLLGKAQTMPENGGRRIRQKFDHASIERDGNVLRYTGDLYPSMSYALPGGSVSLDEVWSSGVTIAMPPPDPNEETHDEPAPDSKPPKPKRSDSKQKLLYLAAAVALALILWAVFG